MRNNLTMDFENQDMTNYQNTMGYLTLLLHQAIQTMFTHKKGKVSSHFWTTSCLGFIFYLGKLLLQSLTCYVHAAVTCITLNE